MEEERLLGGNTHAEVVKIGETVHRPTGHWTPGVHAVLGHLEARGYGGAPRVRGVDDHGREILTYVPGSVVWPDRFALVEDDAHLAQVAAVIRGYHDLVADFAAADTFSWSDRGADPSGSSEIVCHNDLAPWNLVHGSDGNWTFIDWDVAAPGRRSWDLSWALLSFVPLMPDTSLTEVETLHRIATFRKAYGASLLSRDVLTVAVERCEHEAERIDRLGAVGEQPYAQLLADGHSDIWHRAVAHIADRAPAWGAAFST
jgi:hypothetical protein